MSFPDRVAGLLGRRHTRWIAVRVDLATGAEMATEGIHEHSDVELGSVTKTVTGQLWRVALDRSEVTPATVVGDLLPVGGPVGAVFLTSLASHTSGLPRLAGGSEMLKRTVDLYRSGANPYREDLAGLLQQVADIKVGSPRPAYSNLGFQLLGHAIAAAAGTTYQCLVRERYAEPLGLHDTYVPYSASELRPRAVAPRNRRGREVAPWASESVAPAGGVRSSAADLAVIVRALLDETAPGMRALDPVTKFAGQARIGAGWLTMPVKERSVTWHNGGTGGFRACLALDRSRGVGAAIGSATTRSVDPACFELLRDRQ